MKKTSLAVLMALSFALALHSFALAQSAGPQATLNQYVSELQKSPNNYALREKIIKHVQTMRPAPAIPLEAEKFEGRAEFAFKSANSETEFLDAAKEYGKALLIAPWASAYYFNQGVAYEKAGRPGEAKRSFEFYLLAAPNAPDARDVRKRIAGLEYAMEKAAGRSQPEAVTIPKQNAYETWLKGLDGARFIGQPMDDGRIGHERDFRYLVYYVNGQEVRHGWIEGARPTDDFRSAPVRQVEFNDGMRSRTIQNKQFEVPVPSFERDRRPCKAAISDDGQFLTVLCPASRVPSTFIRVK